MAFEAYLEVPDVKGEATATKYKEWIAVSSYSFGTSQVGSALQASGGWSSGKADFEDLTVTKALDLASPILQRLCVTGSALGTVNLAVCQAAGDKKEFFRVSLENAIITQVSQSGGSGDARETVGFRFEKIKWEYKQIDRTQAEKGGSSAKYNLATGEAE